MKRLAILLVVVLGGCSFGPAVKSTPAVYGLGAPRLSGTSGKPINASIMVYSITAPFWLDTPAIVYRLNHQDAGRQQVYANSQWAASPAALLTQRLRDRLAQASSGGVVSTADGVPADYTLRVELEDFTQVFDRAEVSRGVAVARATLVDSARHILIAQKNFTVDRPAASPDAEGGVRALTEAGDDLIEAIVVWTAADIPATAK